VNEILKAEAEELQLGTKKSRGRMAESEGDVRVHSYWAEMEFREFVRRQLEKHPSANAMSLINEGARLLGLSPVTTKRYLAKMRSKNGPFSGLGDIVTINPRYVPPEDDEYWREERPETVDRGRETVAMPRENVEAGE
jgi:hypothetical protein